MNGTTKPKRKAPARRRTKRALSPEQRYKVIQESAYYRAEKDAFRKDPIQYWLEAEIDILI